MSRARDLADLGGNAATLEKQGLTLINTTSFSAVASQALSANTFSSSYTNYRILLGITGTSASSTIYLKLRSGATDSSTGYYDNITQTAGTTYSGAEFSNATTGFRIQQVYSLQNGSYYSCNIELFNPFNAIRTAYQCNSWNTNGNPTRVQTNAGGYHNVETSYDSANIIASTGNITGDVSVYGYNK